MLSESITEAPFKEATMSGADEEAAEPFLLLQEIVSSAVSVITSRRFLLAFSFLEDGYFEFFRLR
jgi:hypothetical protein